MRTTLLILAALAVPLASAQIHQASFGFPSQWEGTGTAQSQWLLVILGPGDTVTGLLETNYTEATYYQAGKLHLFTPVTSTDQSHPAGATTEQLDSVKADLASAGSWSSIIIEAESIQLAFAGKGELAPHAAGKPVVAAVPENSFPSGTTRTGGMTIPSASVVGRGAFDTPKEWGLSVQGLRRLEVQNITFACADNSCPQDSTPIEQDSPTDRVGAQVQRYSHLEFTSNAGLEMAGTARALAFGSSELDVTISGQIRLIDAQFSACSESCIESTGETLVANGTASLSSLHVRPDGRIGGNLALAGGSSARLDESVFDADALGTVPVVAAVSTAVAASLLLLKALGTLFTRIRTPDALRHENRKAIHEAVHRRPGISFNELRRETGLANGTIRHHLEILTRVKLVERRELGQYLRLYPFGTAETKMAHLGVLQRDGNAALLAMIVERPGITQQAILDATPGRPRSSIQQLLKSLTDTQLVSGLRSGRTIQYFPLGAAHALVLSERPESAPTS